MDTQGGQWREAKDLAEPLDFADFVATRWHPLLRTATLLTSDLQSTEDPLLVRVARPLAMRAGMLSDRYVSPIPIEFRWMFSR